MEERLNLICSRWIKPVSFYSKRIVVYDEQVGSIKLKSLSIPRVLDTISICVLIARQSTFLFVISYCLSPIISSESVESNESVEVPEK